MSSWTTSSHTAPSSCSNPWCSSWATSKTTSSNRTTSVGAPHPGELLGFFKNTLMQPFVHPAEFSSDLDDFYVSNYLINELREFYTEKEKNVFFRSKKHSKSTAKTSCKKNWPICYQALENYKHVTEKTHYLFKCQFVLSNYKFDYFDQKRASAIPPSNCQSIAVDSVKVTEDDLLIERQRHLCDQKNEDFDRMRSNLRINILRLVSNNTTVENPHRHRDKTTHHKHRKDSDPSKPYEHYIKHTRNIEEEENLSYSNASSSNKRSNSLTQVQNQSSCR